MSESGQVRPKTKRVTAGKCALLCAGALCLAGSAAIVGGAAAAQRAIELPAETAVLTVSELPGYGIAKEKCGICHSADYVNLQPPNMSLAQWTAEMTKMQRAYGAPIDADEIGLLAIYLASTYGDKSTVTSAAATPAAPK